MNDYQHEKLAAWIAEGQRHYETLVCSVLAAFKRDRHMVDAVLTRMALTASAGEYTLPVDFTKAERELVFDLAGVAGIKLQLATRQLALDISEGKRSLDDTTNALLAAFGVT